MNKYISNTATQALINGFKGKFGNNSALKTTSKNFVGAINELKLAIANLQPAKDYSTWQNAMWSPELNDPNSVQGSNSNFTNFIKASNGIIVAGIGTSGIIYSEDNGKTWQHSNIISDSYKLFNSNNNNILLASNKTTSSSSLKYSEDNGKTWQDSNISGAYADCIIIDANTMITSSLRYSEDSGKTWQASSGGNGSITYTLVTDNGTIVVSSRTGGGIFYSEDNGKTWQASSQTYNGYKFFKSKNSSIIAACSFSNSSVIYSEDNGKTWQNASGASGKHSASISTNNGTLILSHNGSTYAKYSEDGGKTWQVSSGVNSYCYEYIQINNTIVGCSESGIIYSEDNGKTWQNSNASSIVTGTVSSSTFTHSLLLTSNGTVITSYSTSSDLRVIYSEDDGKTWQHTDISYTHNTGIEANDKTFILNVGSATNYIKYC